MKLQILIIGLSAFAGFAVGAATQLGVCPWVNERMATAWFERGKEQISQSRNAQSAARDSLTRAIKLKPDFALAYVFRGLLESDHDAFADYSMAIKLDPKSSAAYNNRAYLYISAGNCDSAILDCNSAIKCSPLEGHSYALRADALSVSGDWEGAIEDYTKAINLASEPPFFVESYYLARGTAREEIQDKCGAMEDYDSALSLNPNDSKACFYRGRLRSDIGNKRGAIQDLDRAIALNPHFCAAYVSRCWVRARLNDEVGAESDYLSANRLSPDDPEIKMQYGIALLALNVKIKALQQFDDAISLDSSYYAPYVWRALTRLEVSDSNSKRAMSDLDKAVAIYPKSFWAHYRRGLLELRIGDRISAKKDLNEALRLNPGLTDAAQKLADL